MSDDCFVSCCRMCVIFGVDAPRAVFKFGALTRRSTTSFDDVVVCIVGDASTQLRASNRAISSGARRHCRHRRHRVVAWHIGSHFGTSDIPAAKLGVESDTSALHVDDDGQCCSSSTLCAVSSLAVAVGELARVVTPSCPSVNKRACLAFNARVRRCTRPRPS